LATIEHLHRVLSRKKILTAARPECAAKVSWYTT
jgi:hypothetical protein